MVRLFSILSILMASLGIIWMLGSPQYEASEKEQPTFHASLEFPAPVANTSPLLNEIRLEAASLYTFDAPSSETEKRIIKRAQAFSFAQLSELKSFVLNEELHSEERMMALYFLRKSGVRAHGALQQIVIHPHPIFQNERIQAHSIEEAQLIVELDLRTQALQSLEDNVHGQAGLEILPSAEGRTKTHPYLLKLIEIAEAGKVRKENLLKKYLTAEIPEGKNHL